MRLAKNIFSPKASRIIRVLLIHAKEGWTVEGLSKEAGVSLGFTHAVVMSLIQQGHVYRDNLYKLRVSDPVRLIQRWAAYHNYVAMNVFFRYHTFERNIEAFFSSIRKVKNLKYALTVLAGAHVVAPYVRPTTVHFYIKKAKDVETWVKLLDLRPVETGGNVSMVLPYDEGVFYGVSRVNGLKVVSKVQLYVDLFNYPARGEEAAKVVLKALEEEWRS
ncbi:MAG: hypothetical protein DRP02_14865 [Candidatus Gerdarchaeota archaeon]|nr:MAG: hypothetical protein DRP02_14865 [Candidatus Gerdarchaeota archaeon]